MSRQKTRTARLLPLFTAVALAACGSDDSSTSDPASPPTGSNPPGDPSLPEPPPPSSPVTPEPTSFALSITRVGEGTVTSSPAGIDCGSLCSGSFPEGEVVTLNAVPASGYAFAGWSGAPGCSSGTTCTVEMTAEAGITATFKASAQEPPPAVSRALTVTVSPIAGGTVVSEPAGIDCGRSCRASFPDGTSVTLSASAESGYSFVKWSGAGESCGTAPTCTVKMSSARTVGAEFKANSPPPATANLCEGLVRDKNPRSQSALAKPERGKSYVDPAFGTTIRRITDAKAQFSASVAKPVYSTIPAWNADESYLILYVTQGSNTGHHLFDGRTYEHIRRLDIDPADIEHFYWSSTDPDVIYYPSGRNLIEYHVSTGQKKTLYTAPSPIDFGDDPMYGSWDNRVYALESGSTGYILTLPSTTSPSMSNAWPHVGPSGTRAVMGDGVYDVATWQRLRTMRLDLVEHAALTRNAAGEDLWAAVQFGRYEGTLITENLHTGEVRSIIGTENGWRYPGTDTHISGHAFQRPGWVAVSSVGWGEILLANVDDGTVCRIGHHRSPSGDYWAEPHVNISPSGTRVLFGSDWGGGVVDTYVIELPSYSP